MADRTRDGLPYGQFGKATYDPEEKDWRFERDPKPGAILQPIGRTELLIQPSVLQAGDGDCDHHRKEVPSIRHARQARQLVRSHPDVHPAIDLLPPLLGVSEAATTAMARHDPLHGNLLAVGTVPSEVYRQSISIVALPTGATGTDLRLAELRKQKQGWDEAKDAWIEVPVLHGEQASWHGSGAAIRQVAFAHAVEGTDAFLAVRLPNQTVILRPMLRRNPPRSDSSRLDPNPVLSLTLDMTGGLSHSDISFNPWYTRQVGVIDSAGNWSLWELAGRHMERRHCIKQGHIPLDDTAANVVADGWARLRWVCKPTVIIVAIRSNVMACNLNSSNGKLAFHNVFVSQDSQDWVLDIETLPSLPNYIAILTAERLMLARVSDDEDNGITINIRVNLRHQRNPQDMTLALSTMETNGQLLIILRSKMNRLALVYRFTIDDNNGVTIFDPMSSQIGGPYAGFHVLNAPFSSKIGREEQGSRLDHEEHDVHFLSVLRLSQELGLEQQLLSGSFSPDVIEVTEPIWRARLPAKSSVRLPRESFVVSDDDEAADTAQQAPSSMYVQRRKLVATRSKGPEWSVVFERTAQSLQRSALTMDAVTIVEAGRDMLQTEVTENVAPQQTLRDLREGEVVVDDIQELSEQLEELAVGEPARLHEKDRAPDIERFQRLALRNISLSRIIRGDQEYVLHSAINIYNAMVDDWITPLPANISGRSRLAKEQIIRRAAAEVALASRIIRVEDIEQPTQHENQSSQQQQWELPVRGEAAPSSQLPPSSPYLDPTSQLPFSQPSALPTPSPSVTPSITTGSSATSIFAPEVSRLSKYTTFSQPTPTALPRSLRNVLSHWQPGTHPEKYDWLATSRRIRHADEALEDEAGMTEKERARMQRRAERHMRRQRKEAAASQAAQMASSQAPEIAVSASQPGMKVESQPNVVAGSSQSQGVGVPSASQVVPGRFGGKPAKKKRKQGF